MARCARRRRGVPFMVPIPPQPSCKTLEPQLSWMAIRERTQNAGKVFEELPCEDDEGGGEKGRIIPRRHGPSPSITSD